MVFGTAESGNLNECQSDIRRARASVQRLEAELRRTSAYRYMRPVAAGRMYRRRGDCADLPPSAAYVHYNMDRVTPRQSSRFIDRLRAGVSRL